MGVRGPKSKIEKKQRFVECHIWRTGGQKWRDSVEKQKRSNLKERDRQTSGQTARVKLLTIMTPS